MCTMTWWTRDGGYELFFNRDERSTRKPALPPAVRRKGEVRFIAPLDGDFGGTWIAVNQWGLTVALQNGYTDEDDMRREPAEGFTSRGLLVTALVDCRSADQLLRRLRRRPLERFRSFLLAAFEPDGTNLLASWLGGRLGVERDLDPDVPIVSSSFESAGVCRARRESFREMRREATVDDRLGLHLAYHASHRPQAGPSSVCMHRPGGQTVSFSWIRVDRRRIGFRYVPHAPCEGLPDEDAARLERLPVAEVTPPASSPGGETSD
jgi:hypothetical protein